MQRMRTLCLRVGLLLGMVFAGSAAESHRLAADFSVVQGEIRPLHGINKGPLAANGLFSVTAEQKELRVPWTRLHECHHPNPDVVDIHTVFPDPDADPARPENGPV